MHVVEAKRAAREMPRDLGESLSAFSNTAGGGVVLLGVDETAGFAILGVEEIDRVTSRVAQLCRDELEPPLRPHLSAEDVDGRPVVVVEVPELAPAEKPCFIKSRGLVNGAFIRIGGTNRKLTAYEAAVLMSNRAQPVDDAQPVPVATIQDLDPELVTALLTRARARRGPAFATADDGTILRRLGVVTNDGVPTLAGLLALGQFPQQFFPQLDVTFTFFARPDREPAEDGTRFLDSASVDGPIPRIVDEALRRVRLNMRHRAVIQGAGRIDVSDYPETALREAVANALMHRDYSGTARGTQVRIEMFSDRIQVESPGGLYGPVSTESLEAGEAVSSSRNALLAKLLEDVVGTDGEAIAENRGSGIATMQRALRDAKLAPPEFDDQVRRFTVRFRNAALVDRETLEWIESLRQPGLSERQVAALALARQGAVLTNARYRAVAGCDAGTATRELGDLRDRGLLRKLGSGQRVYWRLAAELDRIGPGLQLPGRLTGEHRRNQIRRLLQLGDRSTRELVEATGLGKQSVRNYLNDLRRLGEVEPTSERIKSPATRWRLVHRA